MRWQRRRGGFGILGRVDVAEGKRAHMRGRVCRHRADGERKPSNGVSCRVTAAVLVPATIKTAKATPSLQFMRPPTSPNMAPSRHEVPMQARKRRIEITLMPLR